MVLDAVGLELSLDEDFGVKTVKGKSHVITSLALRKRPHNRPAPRWAVNRAPSRTPPCTTWELIATVMMKLRCVRLLPMPSNGIASAGLPCTVVLHHDASSFFLRSPAEAAPAAKLRPGWSGPLAAAAWAVGAVAVPVCQTAPAALAVHLPLLQHPARPVWSGERA